MRKNIAFVAIIAITLAITAGCTQYIFVPVPSPGEEIEGITSRDKSAAAVISFLQSSEYWSIVKGGGGTGLYVNEGNDTAIAYFSSSSTRAAQIGKTIVRFDNYRNDSRGIYIASGILEYDFNVNEVSTKFIASSYSVKTTEVLSYTYQGEVHEFDITITNAPMRDVNVTISGDYVESFDVPSIPIPDNASISVDDSDVAIGDIGMIITDGFGGGSGTETDPYRIYNADQFAYIVDLSREMAIDIDNYYYFDVYEDLVFREGMKSPAIPIFRGEIDFQGHSIEGITENILSSNTTEEQRELNDSGDWAWMVGYGTFIGDFLNGAIRNLEFHPDEYIPISVYGNWSRSESQGGSKIARDPDAQIIFDNVSVYGDFNELGPNSSLYISQVFTADLIMIDCENHADLEYILYGAPFLGGYLASNASATFSNCSNYGDIVGNWAAVFIGNRNIFSQTVKNVTIENSSNYGTVTGFEWVGFYAPVNNAEVQNDEYLNGYSWFNKTTMASNNGVDSNITFMGDVEPSGVTITVDENNQFIISNTNSDYAYFKLAGSTYASLIAGNANIGTMLVRVETPDAANKDAIKVTDDGVAYETGFYKYRMVDSTHDSAVQATPSSDKYGNEIYSVDGTNYYYNDSKINDDTSYIVGFKGDKTSSLTYYLYCYNTEGRLVATKKLADI